MISLENTFLLIFLKLLTICAVDSRPVVDEFDPSKFIFRRNFITRELFYKNLTRITNPDPVRRLRLIVGVTQAASESGFVEVYRLKVRWVEPDNWADNYQQQYRHYELRCEAEEETGNTHNFVKLNVDHSIMGYDEHFMTRRPLPLLLLCGIRCVNGAGIKSEWVWTKAVKLHKLYNQSPYFHSEPMFGHLMSKPLPRPYFGEGQVHDDLAAKAPPVYFPRRRPFAAIFDPAGSDLNSLPQEPNSQRSPSYEGPTQSESPLPPPPYFRRRFPQWEMLKWRNSADKTHQQAAPMGGFNGGQFS